MSEPRHVCHAMDVDGEPVRVLGDPNMPQEDREALAAIVRAVRRQYADEDGGHPTESAEVTDDE